MTEKITVKKHVRQKPVLRSQLTYTRIKSDLDCWSKDVKRLDWTDESLEVLDHQVRWLIFELDSLRSVIDDRKIGIRPGMSKAIERERRIEFKRKEREMRETIMRTMRKRK